MIGWIVEKTSRSGWRQKWRRFRIVTTALSVTLVSAPRSDGACGRGSRRGRSRTFSSGTAAAICGLPFSLGASPVSWRKTSSSVGRRRPMSLTPIPARRSSAAASSTRTRLSRGAGRVSRFGRSSSSGAPQPTRRSAASASSRCPTSVSSTSRIWPPTRSLSSLPVPSAITRPWSMTAISSAS